MKDWNSSAYYSLKRYLSRTGGTWLSWRLLGTSFGVWECGWDSLPCWCTSLPFSLALTSSLGTGQWATWFGQGDRRFCRSFHWDPFSDWRAANLWGVRRSYRQVTTYQLRDCTSNRARPQDYDTAWSGFRWRSDGATSMHCPNLRFWPWIPWKGRGFHWWYRRRSYAWSFRIVISEICWRLDLDWTLPTSLALTFLRIWPFLVPTLDLLTISSASCEESFGNFYWFPLAVFHSAIWS